MLTPLSVHPCSRAAVATTGEWQQRQTADAVAGDAIAFHCSSLGDLCSAFTLQPRVQAAKRVGEGRRREERGNEILPHIHFLILLPIASHAIFCLLLPTDTHTR